MRGIACGVVAVAASPHSSRTTDSEGKEEIFRYKNMGIHASFSFNFLANSFTIFQRIELQLKLLHNG
jgi:hypothetical protein